jgi:hypothetical protein
MRLGVLELSTARSDSASKWELRCATTPSELFASFVSSAIFDDAMKGTLEKNIHGKQGEKDTARR